MARIHSTKPPISSNGIRSWEDVWEDREGKNPTFQTVLNKEYLLHLEKETKEVKEKYCKLFGNFQLGIVMTLYDVFF